MAVFEESSDSEISSDRSSHLIPKKNTESDSFTFERRSDDDDVEMSDNDEIDSPDRPGTPSKSFLFLLMEYCANRTLKDEIYRSSDLTEIRAWSLIRDILEGLNYIHGLKTIHRDLKAWYNVNST